MSFALPLSKPALLARTLPRLSHEAFAAALRRAAALLLLLAIGVEVAVLSAWLPDTFEVWFHPERAGYGDFPIFFRAAQSFHLNATYSPGLAVITRPLTYLSMQHAFWIYTGVNVAAVVGVAFIAQRAVRSPGAKAAIALGILALPQTHWAIRAGHFTEVLTLATLCGLMLADRRPLVAGLLIGVLALKPQYLPVPLIYLVWTRNWRTLFSATVMLAGLALAGVVAAAARMGPDVGPYVARYYAEVVPYIANNLTIGQQDGFYVHAWQYSWYGFLLSAGIDPNPLIAVDLLALSLIAMLLVWWRCSASVAKAGAVVGMLLLTPHATFYNWSLIAAAGALLLYSDLRPRWFVAAIIAGIALALAATQNATPFPIPVDRFRPPETRGLYWVQPAALAALFALAIAGRRPSAEQETAKRNPLAEAALNLTATKTTKQTPPAPKLEPSREGETTKRAGFIADRVQGLRALAGRPQVRTSVMLGPVAAVVIAAGFFVASWVTASGPFAHDAYFSRAQVVQALPADFPAPDGATLGAAGAGSHLPYRMEWDAPAPVNEVAGAMRTRLGPAWRVVDSGSDGETESLRATRAGTFTAPPLVGEVSVTPSGDGSRVRLEFSPLPASTVPGYQRWLESIGLVVHNVEPGTDLPELVPGH